MKHTFALLCCLAVATGATGATGELPQEFEAGVHYQVLPIPVETAAPDAVEVVEVFSYACIHCYNFEPFVAAWAARAPDDVAFRRVPAVFNPVWQLLAQAYYTAEALDVVGAVHIPLFEAIHVHRMDVREPELIARIFSRYADVESDDFFRAYGSFGVDSNVRQARAQSQAYRVSGVPTMIVAGKYRVEANLAGGLPSMLSVVDFLVAREREAEVPEE